VYLRPNKSGKGGKNWLPDRQTHYDTGDWTQDLPYASTLSMSYIPSP
jgi:hypothetical protein